MNFTFYNNYAKWRGIRMFSPNPSLSSQRTALNSGTWTARFSFWHSHALISAFPSWKYEPVFEKERLQAQKGGRACTWACGYSWVSNIIFNFFSSQGALGNGTGWVLIFGTEVLLLFTPGFGVPGIGFEDEDDWRTRCYELVSGSRSRKDGSSANASALSGWIWKIASKPDIQGQ